MKPVRRHKLPNRFTPLCAPALRRNIRSAPGSVFGNAGGIIFDTAPGWLVKVGWKLIHGR
ncbi:MAG: hypothetical protein DCC56_09220 [Anaerolineae bacterium]|nr:MAG: hypothetical protein DCC56_09220 [Anaerolineae bacterium]